MEAKPGQYLGTVIGGSWWKRYRMDGFFARGIGKFWLGEAGLCIHRMLTKTPLDIPYDRMQSFEIDRWNTDRWSMVQPILKIYWAQIARN